ncbi:unnamed protein product, partial [Symbiodinium sp. KB8]
AVAIQDGGSGEDGWENAGTRPERVTVYLMVGDPGAGTVVDNYGPQIALHEWDYRQGITGPEGNGPGGSGGAGPGGVGDAGGGGVAGDGGEGGGMGGDAVVMIGVGVVDGSFRHDANYRHTPGVDLPAQSPETVLQRNVQAHLWYKVDIFINWANSTYKVRINDVTLVRDIPFNGSAVRRIGLYNYHAGVAWFDEVSGVCC